MNQQYRIGDQIVITKVGTVVRADWGFLKKQCEYQILFEDGNGNHVIATIPEWMVMGMNEQRLTSAEIQQLKDRGMPV